MIDCPTIQFPSDSPSHEPPIVETFPRDMHMEGQSDGDVDLSMDWQENAVDDDSTSKAIANILGLSTHAASTCTICLEYLGPFDEQCCCVSCMRSAHAQCAELRRSIMGTTLCPYTFWYVDFLP